MKTQVMKAGLLTMMLAAGFYASPALAGKDTLYPNNASWTVNAGSIASNNVLLIGANGHTTLNVDVNPGDAVVVTATWSIQNNQTPTGANSAYPRNITFSTATNAPSPAVVGVSAISACTLTGKSSTCSTPVSFTAPGTLGTYQVQVNNQSDGSSTAVNTRWLQVNFTVVEPEVVTIDTTLTVDQQCFLLHAGDVDLTATLEETDSGDPIFGADIDFTLDSFDIGTAVTDSDGIATLNHNIDDLGVGDYNLYADFDGDALYNPSNGSATVGISYLFVGFGEPINGDGTSIFGGRTIPIKIRLVDAMGAPVADAVPTVWLTSYSELDGLGTILEKVSSVSAADTGNVMRYAPEDRQYIYNWDARDLANGTYAVVVDLGDSDNCRLENPYAIITVAKKGK